MAADKKSPEKGGRARKALRGRMPTKRTINLILVDENKINPAHAVLGIIAIVILAGLFSKFLVADRLLAMTASASKVSRLQSDLNQAMAAIGEHGDVEDTYAHYTMAGMTRQELDLVDRSQMLGMVDEAMPEEPTPENLIQFGNKLSTLFDRYTGSEGMTLDEFNHGVLALLWEALPPQYGIMSWSVSGNVLTMEVSGYTLRTLNTLARTLEKSPIVDTCAIVTARKDQRQDQRGMVQARLTVYLQQAVLEDKPEGEASGS